MTPQAASQSEKRYLLHLIAFSAILFLIILVVSSVAFLLSMRQIIRTNKGDELTRRLEIKRLKLETSVNGKIALVTKMAESPLIKRFFIAPEDSAVAAMALEELDAYRHAFKGSKIFWISDVNRIFYMDDADPIDLNPDLPVNYWYNMTLHETKTYNFNINYNPDFNVTNLWINAPVFDRQGKPIGMLGTGVDITVFINDLYREQDGKTRFYLFNSAGEITGSSNVELVVSKKPIEQELDGINGLLAMAKRLQPNAIHTFDSPLGKVAVGTIPALEWYAVAIMPDSIGDYRNHVSMVFIVMLAVMALLIFIFNIFISYFLRSLHKTMASLETTSRYKSEFLARMSHEIRTPMNAIIGMSEIARREHNLEHMHEHVGTIKKSATNLLSIINDILDFSKIESGKLEIIPVAYLFSSLIDDVTNIVRIKMLDSPLEFKVDIDRRIPKTLIGDEARVRQVMLNLLNNAIKYTSEGFVSFTVQGTLLDADSVPPSGSVWKRLLSRKTSTEPDQVVLTIKVADSGRGIKEKDLGRLFKDFEQFDRADNKGVEGTGLGLAITKSLVTAMEGTITVRSEYGKGSMFMAAIPQKISRREIIDSERILAVFAAPEAKVLVVDDVPINRTVAKGLLSMYKMQIHTCVNGEEAVKAVQAEEYDMVFMDHMMPVMDGMEATAIIRKLESKHSPTLPIVALTANAIAGVEEMFLQNGFNDFLSKPIDSQKLNAILEKWIPAEKQKKPDDQA